LNTAPAGTDFEEWEVDEREEVRVVPFMETRMARAARETAVDAYVRPTLARH
jgi:hypothetical protein